MLEKESNQFAAELLMPTQWIIDVHANARNFEIFIKQIYRDSKASLQATLIKVFRCIPPGYICAESDHEYRITKTRHSPGTRIYISVPEHEDIFTYEILLDDSDVETFSIGDKQLVIWKIDQTRNLPEITDSRPWRDIINSILDDTGPHQNPQRTIQSINTSLATNYHNNKEKLDQEIFYIIKLRYSDRIDLVDIANHPLFDQYIINRMEELKQKKK